MEALEREFCDKYERDLIKLVKPEEFLYNKKDVNYRNNLAKDKKWREISRALGISEAKCRSKWKALRDQYSRELKRLNVLPGKVKVPKWKHFNSLGFLQGCIRSRKATEENKTAYYADEESCKAEGWGVDFVEFENEQSMPEPSPAEPESQQLSELPQLNSREGRAEDEVDEQTQAPDAFEDEVETFFRSVAMKVRSANLSPIYLTDLQIDILKVINEKFKKYKL